MTVNKDELSYRPCVGVVLINDNGKIFVGERNDCPEAWQMPQGGVDEGEDPQDAAFRELFEETSVPKEAVELLACTPEWLTYDLPDSLIGKVWGGKYRGQKQLWYLFKLRGGEDCISLDVEYPEFARWKWSTPEDLIAEIVPFKKAIYTQVLGHFKDQL